MKMEITVCNIVQDPSHAIPNFISHLSLPHSQVYVEFFALLAQPSQLLWAFFPVLFFHVCYLLPQIKHSLEDEDCGERKSEWQSVDSVVAAEHPCCCCCSSASAAHCFLQDPLSSKAWTAFESCIFCYTELSTKKQIKTRANPAWTLAKITLSSYIKGKHLAWPHKRQSLKDHSTLWNLALDGMETKCWCGNFSSSFHVLLSPLYFLSVNWPLRHPKKMKVIGSLAVLVICSVRNFPRV